jgi:hypothetical protein
MAPRKPKKDPKTAANDAEARSKNRKPAQTTKAPNKAAAKPSPAVAAASTSPDTDAEAKALFLRALPKIAELKAKLNTANANLRNAYKQAKADGFLKKDFDVAFEIQGAEGEKAKKAAIARELTIAKWLGCDLGAQLDLFMQDARVPAADRAFEEGQTASMQNKAAKPPYDPSTEQYRRYMAGFHEHQATLAKGIKPLNPAVAQDVRDTAENKAKSDQQRAQDEKAFGGGSPTSGVAMTRSDFEKTKAAAKPH